MNNDHQQSTKVDRSFFALRRFPRAMKPASETKVHSTIKNPMQRKPEVGPTIFNGETISTFII
jgi:hypothetical protein